MPNIALVLKDEITRLARKEIRVHMDLLKKTLAASRAEVASLKKRVQELEKQAAKAPRISRLPTKAPSAGDGLDDAGTSLRFRSAGMAANRKRLGLSAAEFGTLVGASAQTVYAWEARRTRPGADKLAAIAELRGIGKQEATQRLAAVK